MHPSVRKLVDDYFSGRNPLKTGYCKILPTLVEDVDLKKALSIIENALLNRTIVCSVIKESDRGCFHGFQINASGKLFNVVLRLSHKTQCVRVDVYFNKTLLFSIKEEDVYKEDYKVLKGLSEYVELVFRAPEFAEKERKQSAEKESRKLGIEVWEKLEV